MAIVTGTNAGFVSIAPSVDPDGNSSDIANRANGVKATSPTGDYKVTELGWYQPNPANGAFDWEMALYSDDAGNNRPNVIIGSKITGTLTASTEGWNSGAVDISLSSATTYWLVVQVDGGNYDAAASGGLYLSILVSQTTLPSPYGPPTVNIINNNAAFYAKYEAVVGGLSIPVAMNHYRHLFTH